MQRKTIRTRRRRWRYGWLAAVAWMVTGCGDDETTDEPIGNEPASFAVFSDAHYYDPAMGTSGADFEEDVAADRKLIAESSAIMDAVVAGISASSAQFVLVSGDLTKDGARQSHEGVVAALSQLEGAGKAVYVAPGNHDINNPHSYAYPESGRELQPNITPGDFETLYAEFGYAEALHRDPGSLSYVAQPQEGLWILALDSCNYDGRYPDLSRTGGSFTPETMQWALDRLQEANASGISVIGLLHHGVVEHFGNMEVVFGDYLLDDWRTAAAALADAGLSIVFTGHHHATDVARLRNNARHIIDVQTGSAVTWSCPYRLATFEVEAQRMTIENRLLESIDYDTGGKTFQQHAYDNLAAGLPDLVISKLTGLGVPQATAEQVEPALTPSLIAYFGGDEAQAQDPSLMAELEQMAASSDGYTSLVGQLALNVWNDDTPDSNVTIELTTGDIQ